MRQLLKKYLLFLPLIVLIALPCSAKREIKVLLDVMPASHSNFSAERTVRSCTNTLLWFNQTQSHSKDQTMHPLLTPGGLCSNIFFHYNACTGPALSSISNFGYQFVPRFIFYKKLII